MNNLSNLNRIAELLVQYGSRLIGAVLIWIIGSWFIKIFTKQIGKILDQRKLDASLKPFLKGIVNILLKVVLAVSILSMLGIEMTSFIAILGAVGLAIGMALSGTLQNFAGGVIILIIKPFRVGDVIQAQGYTGKVSEIQIFNTILKTADNRTIIIPNASLSNSAMINYSTEEKRRVDWIFGVAYGENLGRAEEIIRGLCEADSRILEEPKLFIAVAELGDSSVNFTVRAWVKAEDYWGVFFDLNRNIYDVFDKKGINIPYPQMDIHLHKN